MPFNFKEYKDEVRKKPTKALISEKRKYCRAHGSATTSGSLALWGSFIFPPALIFAAASGASLVNSGRKICIIDDELKRRGEPERVRIRDLAGGAALSIASHGIGHGVEHVLGHTVEHFGHGKLDHGEEMALQGVGEVWDKLADLGGDEIEEWVVWITCDRCFKTIYGSAYHCDTCRDFDYCVDCYSAFRITEHMSSHSFTVI